MESVGTQEGAITGVQVGSHEGLNHHSGRGERRRGTNAKTFGDRIYLAHWATEVGGGAESHMTPGIGAGQGGNQQALHKKSRGGREAPL